MTFSRSFIFVLSSIAGLCCPLAEADINFVPSDPETDVLVDRCLGTEGVMLLEGTDVICYNAPIFPEQFLKLNDIPPARQIIITSPGGNVATARVMSTILDRRDEPAIIAGQCMSACAMVLLPGLNQVYIHHTAHIAVHGITMMDYTTWWGWLKGGAKPSTMDRMQAQFGSDFQFSLHSGGRSHMTRHLIGQDVDEAYIQTISDRMLGDAKAYDCRVDPKNYWGMLDAQHLQSYLGDRITGMEAFAQSWDDPNNRIYTSVTVPIGAQTYIFADDYADAICTE